MTLITSAAGAKPGVCSLMLASVLVFAFFHHAFRSPHTLKPGCYNLIYLSQRPGVIISDDLSFIKHYSSIVQKAYKTLGIIRKTFNTTSSLAKKSCFCHLFVLAIYLYGVCISQKTLHFMNLCKDELQNLLLTAILQAISPVFYPFIFSLLCTSLS